jgi:hypothetical protein
MNEHVLDRELRDLFAAGPQRAPATVVDAAIDRAVGTTQRRAGFIRLDRRAWPPMRRSASDPAIGRTMRLVALAALIALLGAVIAIGARLLDSPPTLTIAAGGTLDSVVVAPRAMLWPDGRVLVIGQGGTAVLYDPATGVATRQSFGPDFPDPSVDVLPDGRVLLQQRNDHGEATIPVAWFDVATGQTTSAGSFEAPWWGMSILVLRDGRIVISGGVEADRGSIYHAEVAVFDPATGSTTSLAPLPNERCCHMALELEDGRILFVGPSYWADGEVTETVEVYDLQSQTSKDAGGVGPVRGPWQMPPVELADGRVLIPGAGTVDFPCGTPAPTSEGPAFPSGPHTAFRQPTFIFDPATDSVIDGPVLPHFYGAANIVPLEDGRSLVFGSYLAAPAGCASEDNAFSQPWLGVIDPGRNVVFESYDPMTGGRTLDVTPSREYGAGILLPDGRVMLIGEDNINRPENAIDIVTIR